jgi:hypothetical protein
MSLKYPPNDDLRRLLRFEPDSGAIWLGERRMVLMHTMALTELRQDLLTSVGAEHGLRIGCVRRRVRQKNPTGRSLARHFSGRPATIHA